MLARNILKDFIFTSPFWNWSLTFSNTSSRQSCQPCQIPNSWCSYPTAPLPCCRLVAWWDVGGIWDSLMCIPGVYRQFLLNSKGASCIMAYHCHPDVFLLNGKSRLDKPFQLKLGGLKPWHLSHGCLAVETTALSGGDGDGWCWRNLTKRKVKLDEIGWPHRYLWWLILESIENGMKFEVWWSHEISHAKGWFATHWCLTGTTPCTC